MARDGLSMKILIFGGTRFSGLYLVRRLLSIGHEVSLVHRNRARTTMDNSVLSSVQEHFIVDRKDHKALEDKLTQKEYDVVFDLCGYEPEDVEASARLFNYGIRRYVYCSSVAVYRSAKKFPIDESFPCGGNEAFGDYGKKKWECENVLKTLYRKEEFPAVMIRPTYFYGPGNHHYREDFFLDRIYDSRKIFVPGTGMTLMQLCYVDDLVTSYILAMEQGKRCEGEAFNISGAEHVTLNSYIRRIAEASGREAMIEHIDSDGEPEWEYRNKVFPFLTDEHLVYDLRKAERLLSYKPEMDLLSGLKKVVAFYDSSSRRPVDYRIEDELEEAK